jgi:hypothetical protein
MTLRWAHEGALWGGPRLAESQFGWAVSRDGFDGVGTHYSSGVPTLPQRNKSMNYRSLRAEPVNRY